MELKHHRNIKAEEQKSTPPAWPAPVNFSHSPPASSSSPAHDFEFTVSLCPSGSNDLRKLPSPASNVDLRPADDLFYQCHLLPLHHRRIASTPRTSSRCTPYSSTPPEADDHIQYNNHQSDNHVSFQAESRDEQPGICKTNIVSHLPPITAGDLDVSDTHINSTRTNPKSFSLLALKKGSKLGLKSAKEVLERYVKMVKPFFVWKSKEAEEHTRGRRGNLSRQRWGRHPSSSHSFSNQRYSRSSAPSSAMTSPGNSGILCAIPSSNESTMEDLQNAIQAAIAHCKNSTAVNEEEGASPRERK